MDDSNNKYILGCDIGNGYGYVSLLRNSGEDPMKLFPASYNLDKMGMPTTAYINPPDGKKIEVFNKGKSAELKHKDSPENLIYAIKTRLKKNFLRINNVVNPINVYDVFSAIVRDLIILANEELSNKAIPPIYDIVFTFPAIFADDVMLLNKMQESIENLKINGHSVRVMGRLPEPAAVAIDYLHYMQHIAPKEVRIKEKEFTVLVYDLGHGTFDTAVVKAKSEGTPYKLYSKSGLADLGGRNFDETLYQEFLSILLEKYNYSPKNERVRAEIRDQVIETKIALSDSESYTSQIFTGDEFLDIQITRDRFEELTKYLLNQTFELVQEVLDEAEFGGIKIDAIVLSGGASNMPMVQKGLEMMLKSKYPIILYRPSLAVSFGAARFAYGIFQETKTIEQLTDCGYGIWMPSNNSLEGEIDFVIPSGESRPAKSKPLQVFSESSRLSIKIYKSNKNNIKLGALSINECTSIICIPFNVKPKTKYNVTITALENYDLEIELVSDTNEILKKRLSDDTKKLV